MVQQKNYVILAKTALNNVPTSFITGDIGISPATTDNITGFSLLVDEIGYATSTRLQVEYMLLICLFQHQLNLALAVSNMSTAYTDAAGRTSPDFSELGSEILVVKFLCQDYTNGQMLYL